jgi:osmotically inducible protein OsmC
MDRKGSAIWKGTIREGQGTVATESGTLNNAPYSFTSRFEHGQLGGAMLTAESI